MTQKQLYAQAKEVLQLNDHGNWTQPAPALYPNQWLWDSCFIAIGMRHYDPNRAIKELRSLFAGQWQNGMVPHQIFHNSRDYRSGARMWRSETSPYAPPTIATSGITQPPLLAEAVWRIAEKLNAAERRALFEEFFPKLLAYHTWLYTERNPHKEGLVVLLHPWETGMDDTPPWIDELRYHQTPLWINTIRATRLYRVLDVLRQDMQQSGVADRMSTLDALRFYDVVRRMRRKKYETNQMLRASMFSIEDLFFNAILIRNNRILANIAKEAKKSIPTELRRQFNKAPAALEELWDPTTEEYYSRNFSTGEQIVSPTIATLMPLYAGCVTELRAKQLVDKLLDQQKYWTKYPVPSVPKDSPRFKETHYWQGPTWLNTNWLLIDGLRRYGYDKEAEDITKKSLELTKKLGFREYFSPLDGHGAGATDFAWTAAVAIDLIQAKK